MTIEKLPSGSYRIKQMENGHRYSVTVPYKPGKKEAFELIQDKINHRVDTSMSFKEAADKYIGVKTNVLSPATIRSYTSILRNLPEWFLSLDLEAIDDFTLQKYVNEYSVDHTPKSVSNVHGFICSVIRLFYPHSTISATLPQKRRSERYTPTLEDIKRILEDAKGTEYYIPVYLATLSLRNSEICALTMSDLSDNRLTINKALVRSNNGYVIKPTPKTDKSNRTIILPDDLTKCIIDQGYIYDNYPGQIDKYLRRAQKKLGIPSFGIHRLRHFFASYSHDLGYSDAMIQKMGGWSTDNVMKSVYRHAMNEDQAAESIKKDFSF